MSLSSRGGEEQVSSCGPKQKSESTMFFPFLGNPPPTNLSPNYSGNNTAPAALTGPVTSVIVVTRWASVCGVRRFLNPQLSRLSRARAEAATRDPMRAPAGCGGGRKHTVGWTACTAG
jgi:hypothetical protein